jgi:hypothetical protein
MKTAILLAMAIVTLSSLPFASRQTNASAQENTTASTVAAQTDSSTVTVATALTGSVQVHNKLPVKLDIALSKTESAKTADAIVENAKEKVKTVSPSSRQ